MLRVLLADHQALLCARLRALLKEAWPEALVEQTSDGPATLNAVAARPWDVLLLAAALPGSNGLFVLRQVRRTHPHLPVVVLSLYADWLYAERSRRAGAAGCVSKIAAGEALIPAVRAALAARPPEPPVARPAHGYQPWPAGPDQAG
jgi:DNA-binding NarL/FixJ family response regulator